MRKLIFSLLIIATTGIANATILAYEPFSYPAGAINNGAATTATGIPTATTGGEAYLHDGRARTLAEAILWHGGEAEASKEAFRTMTAADRAALIKFLKSL